MAKKFFTYFNDIIGVVKNETGSYVEYIATFKDGHQDGIVYHPGVGQNGVQMYTINKKGVRKPLSPKPNKRGDLRLNRLNSSCSVNEILYQFDRVYKGLLPVEGEYNHWMPVVYQNKLWSDELIGPEYGDVASPIVNHLHWILCRDLKKYFGLIVSIQSRDVRHISNNLITGFTMENICELINTGKIKLIKDMNKRDA